MKNIKHSLILISTLSMFLSSCCFPDKAEKHPLHEKVMKYMSVFQEGKYWVYSVNNGETFDTLRVKKARYRYDKTDRCRDWYQLVEIVADKASMFEEETHITIRMWPNNKEYISFEVYKTGIYEYYNYAGFTFNKQDNDFYDNNYNDTIKLSKKSILVANISYNDCLEIPFKRDSLRIWLAPNIGIVKATKIGYDFELHNKNF
jgi:hypothetical protein